MADDALVAQLVQALDDARFELLMLNGCAASDTPQVDQRLPPELRAVFWRIDARDALAEAARALAAAEAAGFTPTPGPAVRAERPRPRLVVDNDR